MKKTIIIILALAVVLVGAYLGYQSYVNHKPVEPVPAEEVQQAAEQTPAAEQTQPAAEAQPAEETQPEEQTETAQPEDSGDTAPDLKLQALDGTTTQLSALFGKPMIVNFWTTWCTPCKAELPLLQQAYEQYGQEINFVMVNLTDGGRDTVEGVSAFIEENGYTFPAYCDIDYAASKLYGIVGIPSTVLIDMNGKVIDTHVGILDEKTLSAYIALLSEEAVKAFLGMS